MNAKIKAVARQQNRNKLNKMAKTAQFQQPDGGWIRYIRQALGMTGSQLGRRLGGISKESISQKEKAELDKSITMKALHEAAEAMGCKLVYAIVPKQSIESVIGRQAEKRANEIVKNAAIHMSLEDQSIGDEKLHKRIKDLQKEMLETTPKDLWDE